MRHSLFVPTLAVIGATAAYAQNPVTPQLTLNSAPSRSLGSPALTLKNLNPNLVEGREFYLPRGVAIDTTSSPPVLYVSDYANNRILAWKDANGFTNGQTATMAIGQPDLQTTFPAGPSAVAAGISNTNSGLTRPSGLAVDASGNLYVVDGGNNRVLRYRKPFSQTVQPPVPDLYIGQGSNSYGGSGKLSGSQPNYPNGSNTPSAQGLLLSSGTYGSNTLYSSLAFDSAGNLWVLDTGNSRVLRFKKSDLDQGGSGLTAEVELGQADMVSLRPALDTNASASYYLLNQFVSPLCVGVDLATDTLYVGDLNRVLVFPGPAGNFSSGMSASPHILGVFPANYTFPTATTDRQTLVDSSTVNGPSAIFFLKNGASGVGIVDAGYHRIMLFDTFANWPTDGTPPKVKVPPIGQPGITCPQLSTSTCPPNNGNPQASASVFSNPAGVAYTGTDLFLADSVNHRVLDLPQQGSTFGAATRVLGQDNFVSNSPNLIEGREFRFVYSTNTSTLEDAAIVIDNRTGTPHLYISDPGNNRVLGFNDLRKVCFPNPATSSTCPNGKNKADIVLGQPDFATALINYPSNDPSKPTQSSLYRPVGLLVDAQGNLYVADSFNSRVLRFPAPFAYAGFENPAVSPGATPEKADLVLGQLDFTSQPIKDVTANFMLAPYGLAFSPSCDTASQACTSPKALVVSDQSYNRVLYIPTTNGSFVAGADNGKAATIVYGQSSFNTFATGSTSAGMNSPHHVASDTDGNIYVADSLNNRVLIFPEPTSARTPPTGAQAPLMISGLNQPEGVYVSPHTGEIWVADTGNSVAKRYETYFDLFNGSTQTTSQITDAAPFAIALDQYGDLFMADIFNRVAIFFPGVNPTNNASFLPLATHPLAPGSVTSIFPCKNCASTQFVNTENAQAIPLPFVLGDVQVLVDGTPAPLYHVYPQQIDFVMPYGASTTSVVDLEVVIKSTGQVLGATQLAMVPQSPGIYICPGGVTGAVRYACTLNEDGTLNSASNPAQRGHIVSIYGTGAGAIAGAPPDGYGATAAVPGPLPTVALNFVDVNSPAYQESGTQHVLYSGLDGYPGGWQLNVKIPNTVVVTSPVSLLVSFNFLGNWDATSGFQTYIYVK